MKTKIYKTAHSVQETITKYIANDEKVFKTEQECLEHEALLEEVNKLRIDNPKNVVPYDVWISEEAEYIWVNLKNETDIEIIEKTYNVDVSGISPGIYCIEIDYYDSESYISSMKYSLDNAFALLELAGYDITTLKRKDETDND